MELLRPSSVDQLDGGVLIHGGTEVVPLLRQGILHAEKLIDVRGIVPRGVKGTASARGHHSPSSRPRQIPRRCARRAARGVAAASQHGVGRRQPAPVTRCWYWRLKYPCRLHGGDRCHARDGEHREHAIFANDFCASAHPSDVALPAGARCAAAYDAARAARRRFSYRLPDESNRELTTLEPGELLLELELPAAEASVYLRRWIARAGPSRRWASPRPAWAGRFGSGSPGSHRFPGFSPDRGSRFGNAASSYGVEAGRGASARPACARPPIGQRRIARWMGLRMVVFLASRALRASARSRRRRTAPG